MVKLWVLDCFFWLVERFVLKDCFICVLSHLSLITDQWWNGIPYLHTKLSPRIIDNGGTGYHIYTQSYHLGLLITVPPN